MIAIWMVYALLLGLFVSLAGHALDRAARANGLPSRFVWLAAMIATLVAPVAGYAVRRASLHAATTGVAAGRGTSLGAVNETSRLSARNAFSAAMAELRLGAAKLDREAAIIWAALTLLLLGRLAFATGMVWRNRRTWVVREIDGVPIFVTPDLGPAVVALPRSEIIFPEWLLSLDETHIAMVLRHEREHRAAGDPRLLVAVAVLTALVPWNLALWWQMRRLRLAVEMDCDARVLRADPRVDRYGSLLLAIAQHPRAALYAAATLTESSSNLERRIDAMTKAPSSAPRRTAALLGAFAVAVVFAACMTPAPDVIAGPQDSLAAKKPVNSMFDFEVTKFAALDSGNVPVKYPEQLRAAGVGGVVVAKFVVDTDGRADIKTLMIVKSDHDLFTSAVRQSLPNMRFVPAQLGGRRVKQLMQMPFVFQSEAAAKQGLSEVPVAVEFVQPRRRARDTNSPVVRADSLLPKSPSRLHEVPVGGGTPQVHTEVSVSTSRDTIPPQTKGDELPPKYPNQLRAANIQGQVVVRFLVRANGSVDSKTIEIMKSDHELFAIAVRDALKTGRFSPATIKGKPVDWVMTMPFIFSLSK